MTSEQIVTIIISAIISALVSSLANPFTEKILAAIMPDTKKIAFFLTKVFFFILRYGPASFWVIWLFVRPFPFDKFWVLQFCIQFFILGILVSFDIFFYLNKQHFLITKDHSSIIGDIVKVIKEQQGILGNLAETTGELSNTTKEHISITKGTIENIDDNKSR